MQPIQSYTLPPDKLIQAIEYAHARNMLHFGDFLISVLVLVAILRLRVVPRMSRMSPLWIVSAMVLLVALFDLPAEMYGHSISLRYHISIQGWQSWFWDWTKEQIISVVIAVAMLLPFYALLRRQPRRWWLYAWLASIPIMIVSAYADPLILEPLFNSFRPLSAKHPELIPPIEQMLARAGVGIPPERLLEMDASQKTNSLNAYFSGIGPSSRMVLYDTIIEKEPGPLLLSTIGHELGHYVLSHIAKGLAFGSVCLLLGLLIFSRAVPWFISKWGESLNIASISDWGSLPVFMLLALGLSFFAEPVANAYSRWQEHQADVYSLEAIRGLVPNPGQAAAQAFQVEGENGLEEPNPNPLIVFWSYTHPPVAERLRFSLDYELVK